MPDLNRARIGLTSGIKALVKIFIKTFFKKIFRIQEFLYLDVDNELSNAIKSSIFWNGYTSLNITETPLELTKNDVTLMKNKCL